MFDFNNPDNKMEAEKSLCECGYSMGGRSKHSTCPECGAYANIQEKSKRKFPIWSWLSSLISWIGFLMSAATCLVILIVGPKPIFLGILFYLYVILPTCFIAAVLTAISAWREYRGKWLIANILLIIISIVGTALFLVIGLFTLSNNYWG
jgi:hypothetical protein